MVYVINGVAHEGHKPQGPEYKREPTKFSLGSGNGLSPLNLEDSDSISDMHLYVCAACPWAHRALITRNLSKTLRKEVKVSVVSPYRDDAIGWEFLSKENEQSVKQFTTLPVTVDKSPRRAKTLMDIYLAAEPNYTGNITTPTLYDAKSNKILSNDSFGIMRHFVELVPEELGYLYIDQEEIDREGRIIDAELGNRVYMCGLAKTQTAYETSLDRVFSELDRLEKILSDNGDHSYLLGDNLSLADIQLVSCLVRFDPVYFSLFKCYKRRLLSYPLLSAYLRHATQKIGTEAMCLDLEQILNHYYSNFTSANPNGVIPIGYRRDFLDGGKDEYLDSSWGDLVSEATQEYSTVSGVEEDQANAEERRAKGEFVRGVSTSRNWLGSEDYPLEEDRYVLFVANNCPWCHRTVIARSLYPEIERVIQVSVLFYRRGENGWRFLPSDKEDNELRSFEKDRLGLLTGIDGSDPTKNGFTCARDIYRLAEPSSTQKSVPILFDTKSKRVVSNESADILRMFASFSGAEVVDRSTSAIERINARIYQDVNNGAYKAGFSSDQKSYEDAAAKYFRALSWLDGLLSKSKYIASSKIPTLTDVRLFPTIFRHDPVYFARMKLNVAMIKDYPNLNRWLLDMKNVEAVVKASRIDHCIVGYFGRTGNNLVPFVAVDHDGINKY